MEIFLIIIIIIFALLIGWTIICMSKNYFTSKKQFNLISKNKGCLKYLTSILNKPVWGRCLFYAIIISILLTSTWPLFDDIKDKKIRKYLSVFIINIMIITLVLYVKMNFFIYHHLHIGEYYLK